VYREIPGLEKYLVDRLLKPQCIAILAMSEFGLRQMQHQHRERPALAHLLAKSEVLYPGVQPTGSAPKSAGNELKLLFVGHDYYRKGGPALVRAHKKLRSAGIPVQTTIVSSFNWANTDYVGPPDADGVKAAESELSAEGISRHRSLSTDEVRCLMEQADFLILPTFHDTFGYVVLEAMAVATPVIATATCAQTEIIEPGRSGFLLEFDNDDIGQWSWFHGRKRYGYVEAYWSTIDRLASALAEQLQECWETRSDYEALSAGALARIDSKFNADRTRKRLEEIYEMARH
jgi:glycosyltransferase involved in cell wall biosynthesis